MTTKINKPKEIYVFVSEYAGLIFSSTRNCPTKGAKYLGITKRIIYPILLNSGRILYKADSKRKTTSTKSTSARK